MTQQRILDAAFRAFKQSGSQKLFAEFLRDCKNLGMYWGS